MKRLFGIIGSPLGHTLSPLLHNWGFKRFGIDAEYQAWPTASEELDAFMLRFRETPIEGLSVTIPHKTAVMQYVDVVTELGSAVGAVNTLYWREGALWGENTDVEGFCRPLVAREVVPKRTLILGSGGVSRAAVVGVKRLGEGVVAVAGNDAAQAAALADEFDLVQVPWEERAGFGADLLINATPLGMTGRFEALSPYPREALGSCSAVFDLVYTPYPTRFVADALAAGCLIVPGMEMFLYQAIEQFRLWTGRVLPEEEVRPLLRDALYGASAHIG